MDYTSSFRMAAKYALVLLGMGALAILALRAL